MSLENKIFARFGYCTFLHIHVAILTVCVLSIIKLL